VSTEAQVTDLRCQVPAGVIAVGRDPVRLTWRISGPPGDQQRAYEIEASSAPDFAAISASSGVVESSDQVAVAVPGDLLQSREVRHLRVRVATSLGWTAWSPTLRVEAGLLGAADWVAEAITLPDDPGSRRQAPSPLVRRAFEIPTAVVRARLYVTALGLHRMTINGKPVSDDLLAPGWTTYRRRLLADTYDVTSLLTKGPNVIAGVLADGWYRGRIGWDRENDRGHYGTEVGLIAQLEVDLADGTSRRIATDASWQASTGEIRSADLYDGSAIDLREARPGWDLPAFDASDWQPAAIVPFDPSLIEPRIAPPVRIVEVLPVEPVPVVDGSMLLDARQNISGFVRLRVRGRGGDRVTVRHAEVLEADGSLHTRSLRSAKATDTYVLADDQELVLEPAFTFHGFRYAQVISDADVLDAALVAISSDTPLRGRFECAFEPLNRLHENVVWSQRDNFVSVPSDCPQRDERLGWTGDAQAFATTATTLFDSGSFWASWLRDLELEQDDELGVPSVVPDIILRGELRYGRAGWADAATIVPWAVYESYGDDQILRRQFESMRRWIESLCARQGADGLLGDSTQFGDWLDPDAPPGQPWVAKSDPTYLANGFFVHSARLAADAARVLGEHRLDDEYRRLADRIAAATWSRWREHAVTTQTGCAMALQFRILPDSERAQVGRALAGLVRAAEGRVATGFLGTPLVLPALADSGYIDEAYLMLLRREVPSWLYQVDQGATTVWERWDAILPDGSIHPGTMTSPPDVPESEGGAHMLSFNHYAYGAVIDWVYRHVAGIAPIADQPGYRRVTFAPKPASGIDWARASVDTPYGHAAIDWQLDGDRDLAVDLELPFGTSGLFVAPMTEESTISVDGSPATGAVVLGHGRHAINVTRPRIAGQAAAAAGSAGR
jgi:alpha-L-rhamnosidase